jgi:hypothetical protein
MKSLTFSIDGHTYTLTPQPDGSYVILRKGVAIARVAHYKSTTFVYDIECINMVCGDSLMTTCIDYMRRHYSFERSG